MRKVYHEHMNEHILVIDMGLFIRESLSESGNSITLNADDTAATIRATAGDNTDTSIILAFDEPASRTIPFNPAISRSRLFRGYLHPGYNPGNPNIRIPVQKWKQELARLGYVLSYPGAEARDMTAALAGCRAEEDRSLPGMTVVSDDPSLLQLVDDGAGVAARMVSAGAPGPMLDERGVADMIGVGPKNVRMMLALSGNSIDWYQGVETRREAAEEIRKAKNSGALAADHAQSRDILERNWRLSGIGRDYLDDHAMLRARTVMAWAIGPEF